MSLPGKCVFKGKCELNCQGFVFDGDCPSNENITRKSPCLACKHLAAFHEQSTTNPARSSTLLSKLSSSSSSPSSTQTGKNNNAVGSRDIGISRFGKVKSFEAWENEKSSSNYRKSNSGSVKKKVEDCTMNIGVMIFDEKTMILKPKWGKRLPIKSKTDAT